MKKQMSSGKARDCPLVGQAQHNLQIPWEATERLGIRAPGQTRIHIFSGQISPPVSHRLLTTNRTNVDSEPRSFHGTKVDDRSLTLICLRSARHCSVLMVHFRNQH